MHIYCIFIYERKLGTVLFNHRNGCQQCETFGVYSKEFHSMSFPILDSKRRTNQSFRDRTQPQHHKIRSVIEDLPIDMIASFPTSDPLHLLELGVMRKLMYRWVYGNKSYKHKWSKPLVGLMSRLLLQCQKHMPMDIHRAVRSLESLRHWKGLEYRTVLLYVGVVALKEVRILYNFKI